MTGKTLLFGTDVVQNDEQASLWQNTKLFRVEGDLEEGESIGSFRSYDSVVSRIENQSTVNIPVNSLPTFWSERVISASKSLIPSTIGSYIFRTAIIELKDGFVRESISSLKRGYGIPPNLETGTTSSLQDTTDGLFNCIFKDPIGRQLKGDHQTQRYLTTWYIPSTSNNIHLSSPLQFDFLNLISEARIFLGQSSSVVIPQKLTDSLLTRAGRLDIMAHEDSAVIGMVPQEIINNPVSDLVFPEDIFDVIQLSVLTRMCQDINQEINNSIFLKESIESYLKINVPTMKIKSTAYRKISSDRIKFITLKDQLHSLLEETIVPKASSNQIYKNRSDIVLSYEISKSVDESSLPFLRPIGDEWTMNIDDIISKIRKNINKASNNSDSISKIVNERLSIWTLEYAKRHNKFIQFLTIICGLLLPILLFIGGVYIEQIKTAFDSLFKFFGW